MGLNRALVLLVLALFHALADVLDGLAKGAADLGEVLGPKDDQHDDEDDDDLKRPHAKNHDEVSFRCVVSDGPQAQYSIS